MKLDLLAFGVHPDDVELSCAGTLLVEKLNGRSVGIIDLTQGELGTRGSAELRKSEAADAAKIMGITVRENLQMADGFFRHDEENQLKIISVLRKYQPEIIICNSPDDRHPDHARSAKLVSDAAFLSGLKKIKTFYDETEQEAWRPKYVLHYLQDKFHQPDFVIDISEVIETKIEAIKAYSSQFYNPDLNEPETYISTPDFLDSILYRSKMLGRMIGVKHAEGFLSPKMIGFRNLDGLIKKNT